MDYFLKENTGKKIETFINHSGMKSLRIKVSFEESRKELLTQTASKAQGEAQEKTLEFC